MAYRRGFLNTPTSASSSSTRRAPQSENIVPIEGGLNLLPSMAGIAANPENLEETASFLGDILGMAENPREVSTSATTAELIIPDIPNVPAPTPSIPSPNQPRILSFSERPYEPLLQLESYPPPSEILANVHAISDLNGSNLTTLMGAFNAQDVYHSGEQAIGTMFGTVRLSVYDQVQLRVMATYYQSLPPAEPSPDVYKLLLYYGQIRLGVRQSPEESLQRSYLFLSGESLDHLANTLCRLCIPPTMNSSPLSEITDGFARSAYERTRSEYEDAVVSINFLELVCKGFSAELQPIPDLAMDNENLDLYLSRFARGTSSLTSAQVFLRPFVYSAEVFSPEVVEVDPTAQEEEATVTDAPQRPPERPAVPIVTPEMFFGESTRVSARSRVRGPIREAPQRSTRPAEELIRAGDPGPTRIIRDTTEFRGHVESLQSVERMLTELAEGQVALHAEVAVMNERTGSFLAFQETVTNLFADLRTRIDRLGAVQEVMLNTLNSRDLMSRQSINQTILPIPATVALPTVDPIRGQANIATLKENVIQLLTDFSAPTAAEITEQLNQMITDTPLASLRAVLSPERLLLKTVRDRIIARITRM